MNAPSERDILREALRRGDDCPAVERLVEAAWAAEPDAEQRGLLAHAANCAACAAELELARAFDAAPRSAAERTEIARITRALAGSPAAPTVAEPARAAELGRVLPMKRRERKVAPGTAGVAFAPWTRWAAAALVVVGLAVTLRSTGTPFSRPLPDAPGADVVRGGRLALESPKGELAVAPAIFDWSEVERAASYRFEIRDVAGDVLFATTTTESRFETTPDLAARLESEVRYDWRVVALDAAGREIARSDAAAFRVVTP